MPMPLELPSKWEIIPIHTSDRGTFKQCRRQWDWRSPSRHNLVKRVDMFGLTIPLWFGAGIHYALEQYYNPGLRRDPVEAFLQWFDIVYNGGLIPEEWLFRVYDSNPIAVEQAPELFDDPDLKGHLYPGLVYRAKGLNTLLPNEDHSEIFEHKELGIGMMQFYKDYAERNDDFEVVAVEHDFSVPIWDFEHECILHATDTREDSPNFGKELEVHYRGRMDTIKLSDFGKYGIIDHKTTGRIDEDWFRKLELDEQCTSYLWAAEVEAQYYDLPYKKLEDIIYQALRKTYPKPPTINKDGSFSIDRKNESTTYELLMRFIGLSPYLQALVEESEKHKAYVEYVKESGDEQFIIRKSVTRNRHQLISAGQRIYLEALDMLSNPRIYPNPSGDYACLNCEFRGPCIAKEDGSDWQAMIAQGYVSNKDR